MNDCSVRMVMHVSPVDGDVLSLQKEPLAAVMQVQTGKPHYTEQENAQTDLRQMRMWTAGQIEQRREETHCQTCSLGRPATHRGRPVQTVSVRSGDNTYDSLSLSFEHMKSHCG